MSDWERAGRYVVARRVKLGFKQRPDFAAALQISVRVLSDIENGRRGNFDPVTIASLENVLGWETGSFTRAANGGEPTLRESQPAAGATEVETARGVSDEIEMIYHSQMTTEDKLAAIGYVLKLRAKLEAEARAASGDATESGEATGTRPQVSNNG